MDTGETFPHGAQQCRMETTEHKQTCLTEAETLQMRLVYAVIDEFMLWKQ